MLDTKVKRTLKCMWIGTAIYNIVLLVLSSIIFLIYCNTNNFDSKDTITFIIKNIVCILIGFICSVVGLYSMAASLSKAISANDEKYAKSHMVLMSLVRLIAFCIILIIVINKNTFGLVGGIMFALATLGVKVSAYLAPTIEKKIKP